MVKRDERDFFFPQVYRWDLEWTTAPIDFGGRGKILIEKINLLRSRLFFTKGKILYFQTLSANTRVVLFHSKVLNKSNLPFSLIEPVNNHVLCIKENCPPWLFSCFLTTVQESAVCRSHHKSSLMIIVSWLLLSDHEWQKYLLWEIY